MNLIPGVLRALVHFVLLSTSTAITIQTGSNRAHQFKSHCCAEQFVPGHTVKSGIHKLLGDR